MPPSILLETLRIRGFKPYLIVAFLNAVVDIGHKITIQNTLFKIYDDSTQVALTAVVNGMILLPYIMLFSPAAHLNDRFSKVSIMRWSAGLAVIITIFITLSYYQGWFITAFALTLLLAIQSAIYSPAKYSFARILAGEERLVPANGFIQATTILAILTGLFSFTLLFEWLLRAHSYTSPDALIRFIAPLGWLLIALSVIELISAFRLADIHEVEDKPKFDWPAYVSGRTLKVNLACFTEHRSILYASLALAGFWAVSQTLLATFPAFAKLVMHEHNTVVIQGLLACSGIGIVLGALLAGRLNNKASHAVSVGLIGMLLMLFVLPKLATPSSFALVIIGFGFFGGLFIVPLNAHIQRTAPMVKLGTILAANNWVHNLLMMTALLLTYLSAKANISSLNLLLTLPILACAWYVCVILLSKPFRKS